MLTKADLCDDPLAALLEAEQVAFGVPAHVVSNVTGEGLDELAPYLGRARTVALLGSSGVGKSTLANRLLGAELQATKEIADDGRGRHTTTARQLFRLPGGALLVDTPGLREIQLWDADEGIEQAFGDVDELAADCRFNDCAHMQEPGCAVQAAIDEGHAPAASGCRATARCSVSCAASPPSRTRACAPRSAGSGSPSRKQPAKDLVVIRGRGGRSRARR